jgi:tetratricopeptide (TPR) repeat protein
MSSTLQEKTRLESWKEIAAYLRRSERTVMRWETERGLPVKRVPGLDKSRVYAEIAELEAWRRGEPAPPEVLPELDPEPRPVAPRHRAQPRMIAAAVALTAIAVAAAIALAISGPLRRLANPPPSLAAQRFYLAGMDDWALRTPEGLNRAVSEFGAAINRDPDYGEAYAGLAVCYDLLREYTLMPSSQAYQLAAAAAEKALTLDDRLSYAHAALGFAEFYGSWKTASARHEFGRAVELDPRNDTAHHWRATFLLTLGDVGGAVREIESAHSLNPSSLAIAADRAFIRYAAGHRADAFAALQALEAADPNFLSPHNYLSSIYFDEGADQDYLRESETAAKLQHDRAREDLIVAARAGLASGGHKGMVEAIVREETDQFQAGESSAFPIARGWALLGDQAKALDYLRLSIDRRDTDAIGFVGDPVFAALRRNPQFQRLARRVLDD